MLKSPISFRRDLSILQIKNTGRDNVEKPLPVYFSLKHSYIPHVFPSVLLIQNSLRFHRLINVSNLTVHSELSNRVIDLSD